MLLPAMTAPPASLADASRRLLGAPAADVVAWGVTRFGTKLASRRAFPSKTAWSSTSRGGARRQDDGVRVFSLDTGRLPDETYMTAERVRMKYGVNIEWVFPRARRRWRT